jgi:PAS domain S-box-containing protein
LTPRSVSSKLRIILRCFPEKKYSYITTLEEQTMADPYEFTEQLPKSDSVRARQGIVGQEWEHIFQAIGHPSLILQPDHTIIACNKAVESITGKSAEQLIGKKCWDIFHAKGTPPGNCPMEKLLKSGRFETYEMEMEAIGKSFLVSCTPIFREPGVLDKIIHIATDITELKRTKEKLQESRSAFQTLFESGAEGILVATVKERKFKYANPVICRMLGYTQDELTKMSIDKIHPPESLEYVTEQFNLQASGKSNFAADIPCLRKDGTVFYAYITGTKTTIDGEECHIGFFTDVTELRQTQEMLRKEGNRAQKYLDIAAVMFVVIDAKGTITLINKKGCEILGGDETRIVGKNWFESFIPERIRDKVREVFEQLMAGKIEPVEYFENPILRHDGQERIIAWHNQILTDNAGNITGTVSSGEDITERKLAEKQLLYYQGRLKALVAELSLAEERERMRIAMGLHDDVAQKIVMSKFRLQVLKESLPNSNMKKSLDKECILMDDILDDIRSLTFELSDIPLKEISFESALKSWLKSEIQEKAGLKCEFSPGSDKPELDEDIKVILFKAVRELLTNIVKHARARTVRVGITTCDAKIAITVQDDGVGFDVGKLGLPSGDKGGFGLFNIRERLEYIGGQFEIESSPGKGTRIVIKSPTQLKAKTATDVPEKAF